eukprot:scaffold32552_cov17-Prasinocladus_malaysianus.AAC.1
MSVAECGAFIRLVRLVRLSVLVSARGDADNCGPTRKAASVPRLAPVRRQDGRTMLNCCPSKHNQMSDP